jgi:Uncharacterized protein conserved in bacteria
VNLLLDTHVALWAIADDPKLNRQARKLITDPKAVIWVSAASVWEMAIKRALGRGDTPIDAKQALEYFQEAGYRLLPVDVAHAAAVEDLPAHHHDPFDRILVAQAIIEPMRLLTHDATVARYSDSIFLI